MHNNRLLRFLLILIIVVLTIFIYTTYSSNTTLAPAHLRSASPPSGDTYWAMAAAQKGEPHARSAEEKPARINANSLHAGTPKGGAPKAAASPSTRRAAHHRPPTIDADAGDGNGNAPNAVDDQAVADEAALERFAAGNDMLEDQYGQAIENTIGNLNASGQPLAAQKGAEQQQQSQQLPESQQQQQIQIIDSNLNKIAESDVLIPTSNLQKFIENADRILKNITNIPGASPSASAVSKNETAPSAGEKATAAEVKLAAENLMQEQSGKGDDSADDQENDEALPPSVVMTIKRAGSPSAPVAAAVTAKVSSPPAAKKAAGAPTSAAVRVNATTPADTTQGILTQMVYEAGHLNEEINIERLCPNRGSDLKLLILITSAQSHAEARMAIRQTWGHYGTRRDVSTAFVLGRSGNESLNLALSQENFIYGDLIRGNFVDSYNNLTLKTLSSLEWVDQHCAKAKYILKTDDDMFINVPKLLSFLEGHAKDKRTIFGRLAKKWKPIRNKKSKYYVSTSQFSATVFPAFTTGPAYVLTSDIVHELYTRALQQVYLKLEDVFTTGIVAQELGIKRVHVNEFLNRRIAFNPCNIRKTISVHMIKSNEQFDLWKKLLDQSTKCK